MIVNVFLLIVQKWKEKFPSISLNHEQDSE